ncbi:MAG: TetR/AcrR family transcriptional regulator [Streptosporangiaceae bacterium]|jgi:AcrR family transcriptional regulator
MNPAAVNLTAEPPGPAEPPGDEYELGPLGERCPDARDATAHLKAGPDHGPASGRRPGRPRSERAEQAIIEAALELFAEKGADGLCVEEVAARAGVGKATVYRRWHNKEDLLLAALGSLKSPLPDPRGESVRDDLIAIVTVMSQDSADPRRTRQYTLLLGEGEKFPRLMARYTETLVEPRRNVIRSVLRRGIENGQVRPDIDVEIAMLTLTGAAMSRGKCETVERNAEFAERVVDNLLLGLSPR